MLQYFTSVLMGRPRLGSRRLNDFPAGLWKLRLKSG